MFNFRFKEMDGEWKSADTMSDALDGISGLSPAKVAKIQEFDNAGLVLNEWIFHPRNRQGYRQLNLQQIIEE